MNKDQLLSYDGFICFSGDGTVHQLINGLFNRKDFSLTGKVPKIV